MESLEPGSQEGVLNGAFETAPHLHLTRIPPLPQVTTPHLLVSGLVHYLINGLTRTGKSQPSLYLGSNKQPMPGLCGGTAEPAVGSKLSVYRQLHQTHQLLPSHAIKRLGYYFISQYLLLLATGLQPV